MNLAVKQKTLYTENSVALSYDDIFDVRGGSYDVAMQKYPDARNHEFEALFYKNTPQPNETIIDLPSGGAYLKKYVPASVSIDSWEISEGFVLRDGIKCVDKTRISKDITTKYDRAVCCAALHHVENKLDFISQLSSTVKKGGMVHLADVADESKVKDFLEIFVDSNNDLGHKGMYMSENSALPIPADLTILRKELVSVPWEYKNLEQCAEYCKLMFGLNKDTKHKDIIDALKKYVGITESFDRVSINWELMYIDLLVNQ